MDKDAVRVKEINRILVCQRQNPQDILDQPTTATAAAVKKQYRILSIRVHPDKCPTEQVEKAKQAFALLNSAKDEQQDDEKRIEFTKKIAHAREQVIQVCTKQEQERRRVEAKRHSRVYLPDDDPIPMPDFSGMIPNFDELIKVQLREDQLLEEWKKRQEHKEISAASLQAHREKEIFKTIQEAEQEEKKMLEDTRESRAVAWRQFQQRRKFPVRPPAPKAEVAQPRKQSRILNTRDREFDDL